MEYIEGQRTNQAKPTAHSTGMFEDDTDSADGSGGDGNGRGRENEGEGEHGGEGEDAEKRRRTMATPQLMNVRNPDSGCEHSEWRGRRRWRRLWVMASGFRH